MTGRKWGTLSKWVLGIVTAMMLYGFLGATSIERKHAIFGHTPGVNENGFPKCEHMLSAFFWPIWWPFAEGAALAHAAFSRTED
jgi:disulfide bond formation protein DsbB